jgi:hypothetical protein
MSYDDCGFILMLGVDTNTSLSADGQTDQVFLAFLDSYPRDHVRWTAAYLRNPKELFRVFNWPGLCAQFPN